MKGTDVETVKGTLDRRDLLVAASEEARLLLRALDQTEPITQPRPGSPEGATIVGINVPDYVVVRIRSLLAALSESDTEGDSR